jgi:hypothetical protein
VNFARASNKNEVTEIVQILRFLADFLKDREGAERRIARLLREGLVDATTHVNLFERRFSHLNGRFGSMPAALYDDILKRLFNAPGGGALHLDLVGGAKGEIALRVGNATTTTPFGVINVGDAGGLWKKCLSFKDELHPTERNVATAMSLFHRLDEPNSPINVLIGSRKFMEGWNSWRVSTMGLLNVGVGEGAQVIQLFGRGVRLKGFEMTLKRSNKIAGLALPPRPPHLDLLETLNIFGVRAKYMQEFDRHLGEERVGQDDRRVTRYLPAVRAKINLDRLCVPRLRDRIYNRYVPSGEAFRALGRVPELLPPDETCDRLRKQPVIVNWYPKIEARKARELDGAAVVVDLWHGPLPPEVRCFLDIDALFFELERFKADRRWHNLTITRNGIRALLDDDGWYRLYIPQAELAFSSFGDLPKFQDIALTLLTSYARRYYQFHRAPWESRHLYYARMNGNDANFPDPTDAYPDGAIRLRVDRDDSEMLERIEDLRQQIEDGRLAHWEFRGLEALGLESHLYQPLMHVSGRVVEVIPVALNDGEWRFARQLKDYVEANAVFFAERDLYLLRNHTNGV